MLIRLLQAMVAVLVLCSCSAATERPTEKDDCGRYVNLAAPKYKIARQFRGGDRGAHPMLVVYASIDAKYFNRAELLILSCKLGNKFSSEYALMVRFFDNHDAAKKYEELGEGNSARTQLSCRAVYGLLREEPSQSLDWMPDPRDPSRWIHIDLGKPPTFSGKGTN